MRAIRSKREQKHCRQKKSGNDTNQLNSGEFVSCNDNDVVIEIRERINQTKAPVVNPMTVLQQLELGYQHLRENCVVHCWRRLGQ